MLEERALAEKYIDAQEIIKADQTRDVNHASKYCWVLIHLYQDYVDECRVMEANLEILAKKFKDLKILKIKATQCIGIGLQNGVSHTQNERVRERHQSRW